MAARREVDIVLILHVMREAAEQRFHDLVSNYQMNGFGKLAVVVNSCGTLIGYRGIEMCEIDGKKQPEPGLPCKKKFIYYTQTKRWARS